MSRRALLLSIATVGLLFGLSIYLYQTLRPRTMRGLVVWEFLRDPDSHADKVIPSGTRCGSAPFVFPTTGLLGFLWGDSFRPGHSHQGLDIFAGTKVGVTPIIAAYDGYLTRLPEWKSSVIIRVPSDPFQPELQIWLYYTHMADKNGISYIEEAFPAGTNELFVPAGTLLGYQGNFSGDPNNPVGVHLHFSIVQDDGSGHFKNELEMRNTLDPSPYFGMRLNASENVDTIPVCEVQEVNNE